jgi:hypothetical protein
LLPFLGELPAAQTSSPCCASVPQNVNLLLEHFALTFFWQISALTFSRFRLGLLRIWQDGKVSAIRTPSKRISSGICSIERPLNSMTRQLLA